MMKKESCKYKLEKLNGLDVYVLLENGRRTKYSIKKYRSEYKTSLMWWKVFNGEKSLGSFENREEAVFFLKRRLISDKTDKFLEGKR